MPELLRLPLVEGADQVVERLPASGEPQFGAARVPAEVVEYGVDDGVHGVAQDAQLRIVQGSADALVQVVRLTPQQPGLDLMPVGEVGVNGGGRNTRPLTDRLESGGLMAAHGERLGRVADGLSALHPTALHSARTSGRRRRRPFFEYDARSHQRPL
ncbi:hypothetical protein [Streptomyces sp. NPDC018045]|uniref:hypothetical protein n=1 Tax=Streptomyces sp. NPDC018045 TaxID=3365037 RepID=UPI0037948403